MPRLNVHDPMSVDVKICGLKTAATMNAALAAGADYVGLVFFAPSPRNVDVAEAAKLADLARGKARIVALFVDPDDALLDAVIARVRPDIVQLHGSETPERISEIRRRTDASIMKAVKVATSGDVSDANLYARTADIILFDAKAPVIQSGREASSLPGGNGERFDWRLLDNHDRSQPWMLSGGLDQNNVADAIRETGATAVDVSSGVERAKGEKDPALIADFIKAARAATQSVQGVQSHVEA